MKRKFGVMVSISVACLLVAGIPKALFGQDPSAPSTPVKLIFIHHSCGENWLADVDDMESDQGGGLGTALQNNNYFVSDTNYGWGPDSIGDNTDFGYWYDWFSGSNSATYMTALYTEYGQNPQFTGGYTRMATDPGGENQIVMFKSCYPNSGLGGGPGDSPTTGSNPLRSQDSYSEHHTVANAKGIYNDLLTYFATRTDKLFIAVTAPPMAEHENGNDATQAANARAFNNWLVNDWLAGYPNNNVAVFDFYNVLTSNGGDKNTNDAGQETGNHHRWYNGAVQHVQTVSNNNSAYAYVDGTDWSDSHPTAAGNQKATTEFVPLLNYWYQQWKGTSAEKYLLYYPHIASDGTWETEICVINTSSEQSLSGALKAFDNSGQLLDTISISLDSNARREIAVGTDFSNPASIGYVIFESDSESVCGYLKFYVAGKYRVAIPAASEVNTGDIYVSHIASDANWTTGISILNTTSSSKTLTIEFDDGATQAIPIAANKHQAFTIRELFGGVQQPNIQSAVIKNGSGIVGLEIFGTTAESGLNYLSGILLKDETTTTIYYPHVASDDTWGTGIVAYNPSTTSNNLTITPYDENGALLSPQTFALSGKQKYVGSAEDLGLPIGTVWFSIEAVSPITGFELFSTKDGKQLGGYTGVGISGTAGIFAKIDKAGGTGIAFVNIENTSAAVTITAYDNSGNVVAAEALDLSAHEKVVDVPSELFSQDISAANYIAYASGGNIVGFQLNVSSDNMMLDALPAIGVKEGGTGGETSNFVMTSQNFNNGETIPGTHGCTDLGGNNQSPQLAWSNPPLGTISYALVLDDEVSPCGTGDDACIHWSVFNIPASTTSFAAGQDVTAIAGVAEGQNYMGTNGYEGPCPPSQHTYKFTIYALKDGMTTISSGEYLTRSQFQSNFGSFILDSATLQGLFAP